MSANSDRCGVLKVFARVGDKFTRVPLCPFNFTIGSDPSASIKVCRDDVDPIHCMVKVQSNGLCMLINKSKEKPVPINDKLVPKEMYLLPNDKFSVMGKRFLYENPHLSSEILFEAKMKNNETIKKMKRTTNVGRNLLTPQPEKPRTLKPRRSQSLHNLDAKAPEEPKSLLGDDSAEWLLASSPESPHPTITTSSRCFNGFTVSTPSSAVKPSLRNAAIFRSLAEMNFVEPQCESSSSNGDRDEVLKTPITDLMTQADDEMSTPLNNTSVVSIESPCVEEETPLRSRKSKAKDISVQRLTQHDDGVVVLDTPDSKTPKSALKVTTGKNPIGSIHKTKLMDEYSDSDNGFPSDAVIDLAQSTVEAIEDDNESSSDELKPSRKSSRFFFELPKRDSDLPSSKDGAGDFVVDDNIATSKDNTMQGEFNVSCGAVSSTPACKKTAKNIVDEDGESSSALDTTTTTESDVLIGGKRKRDSNTTTEDMSRKRFKVVNTDESIAEMNSFCSQDFTSDNEEEYSALDEESALKSPAANVLTRKAMTEPRQTKKTTTRRSLTDRISNQENEPESNNTTCETVDTSSFVYVKNNVTFENAEFGSEESVKKTQKEPLNDLTDVAGVKKLMQTPRVVKDAASPTGIKRLMKTPKVQKVIDDDVNNMSGVKALMKTPAAKTVTVDEEQQQQVDESVASVFNMSGVSALNDDEEEFFPVRKVTRTYGKSLPAGAQVTGGKLSRKTEGYLLDVSPDVEEWVEKSVHLSEENDDNDEVDNMEQEVTVRRNNRGCSLPAANATKVNRKTRKTEGVVSADFNVKEWTKPDTTADFDDAHEVDFVQTEELNDDNEIVESEVTSMSEFNANVSLISSEQTGSVVSRKSLRKTENKMEEAVSRKSTRKSVAKVEETSDDEDISIPEEPVVSSRKSVRKTRDAFEHDKSTEEEIVEVPVALARRSTRYSSAKVESNDMEDLSDGEDIPGEPVVAPRKSVRKTINLEEIIEDDESMDEVEVEKPTPRKSVRKSMAKPEETQTSSRKSVRKTLTKASPEEENDSDIDDFSNMPAVSDRKSSRKSLANIEANDEDLPEESTVSSRNSLRKTVTNDASDEDENDVLDLDVSEEDEEILEEQVASPRKSVRKTLNKEDILEDNDASMNELEVDIPVSRKSIRKSMAKPEEAQTSSRKSVRKTLTKAPSDEDNHSDLETASEEPAVSPRKSYRKTLTKDASDEDENEDFGFDIFEQEPTEDVSRKSIRKSLAQVETYDKDETMDDEDIPEEQVASDVSMNELEAEEPVPRKSIRKSMAKPDETQTSSRKSVRQTLPKLDDQDDSDFEVTSEEPVVSSRKSSRKTLTKDVSAVLDISEQELTEDVSRKSIRKSLAKVESNDEDEVTDEEDIPDDQVVSDASMNVVEAEEPVPRKSIRKSMPKPEETQTSSRKSVRKTLLQAPAKEQDDSDLEDASEEPVSSRKSSRKTLTKDVSAVLDISEQELTEDVSRKSIRKSSAKLDTNDKDVTTDEDIPEEPVVSSRKSIRKSMVKPEETSSRMSIRKTLPKAPLAEQEDSVIEAVSDEDENDDLDLDVSEQEPTEAVSRKSIRKSSAQVESNDKEEMKKSLNKADESLNEAIVEELDSRESVRKSMAKPEESQLSPRKSLKRAASDEENDSDIDIATEEPVVSSRKSSRQTSTKDASNVDEYDFVLDVSDDEPTEAATSLAQVESNDEDDVIDEKTVSRKSVRKSIPKPEEQVASPRKSLRKTLPNNEEDNSDIEEPAASSRKSFRKSVVIEDDLPEDSAVSSRKSTKKSLANVESNDKEETSDDEDIPEESDAFSRNSTRKLSVNLETNDEDLSSRKSTGKILAKDTSYDLGPILSDEESTSASTRKSSRKSLPNPKYVEEPNARKSLNISGVEALSDTEDSPKTKTRPSSRASVRSSTKVQDVSSASNASKSLKSRNSTVFNVTEDLFDESLVAELEGQADTKNEEENQTTGRKSVRKSIVNRSVSKAETSITSSATKKDEKQQEATEQVESDEEIETPKKIGKSNASIIDKSLIDEITPKSTKKASKNETFVTPAKATPKKDDTTFKTPKVLPKTPARSGKKSAKKMNMSEPEVTTIEVVPERKSKRVRVQKGPKNDLSDVEGVAELMASAEESARSTRKSKAGESPAKIETSPKKRTSALKAKVEKTEETPGEKRKSKIEEALTAFLDVITPFSTANKEQVSAKVSTRSRRKNTTEESVEVEETPKQTTRAKRGVVVNSESKITSSKRRKQNDESEAEQEVEETPKQTTKTNKGKGTSEVKKTGPKRRRGESVAEADDESQAEPEVVQEAKSTGRGRRGKAVPVPVKVAVSRSGRVLKKKSVASESEAEQEPDVPKEDKSTAKGRKAEVVKSTVRTRRGQKVVEPEVEEESANEVESENESEVEQEPEVPKEDKSTAKGRKAKVVKSTVRSRRGQKVVEPEVEEESANEVESENETEAEQEPEVPKEDKSTAKGRKAKVVKPTVRSRRGQKVVEPEVEEESANEVESENESEAEQEPELPKEVKSTTKGRKGKAQKEVESEAEAEAAKEVKTTAKGRRGKTVVEPEVEKEAATEVESVDDSDAEQEPEPPKEVKSTTKGRKGKAQKAVEPEADPEPTKTTTKPTKTRSRRGQKVEENTPAKEVKPTKGGKGKAAAQKEVEESDEESEAEEEPPKEVKTTARSRRGQKLVEPDVEKEPVNEVKPTSRARKGKAAAHKDVEVVEVSDDESKVEEEPPKEVKTTARNKRGQKVAKKDEVEESETTEQESDKEVKKPTRARRGQKMEVEEAPPSATKAKRGRPGKIVVPEEQPQEEEQPAEKPAKARRGRKATIESPQAEKQEATPQLPAKRSRRVAASASAKEETSEEGSPATPEAKVSAKKPARAPRGKATKKTAEEEKDAESAQETKPAPAKRGRRVATKTTDDSSEAIVDEATPKKPAPKRNARKAKSDLEADTDTSVEVKKPAAKRGRRAAVATNEEVEVEKVVTKTREVKGVKVTTVSVTKKVGFVVEDRSEPLALTPEPRVAKRRLKSEDELNDSDSMPLKRTRSRK